jgi:hypothetical protein
MAENYAPVNNNQKDYLLNKNDKVYVVQAMPTSYFITHTIISFFAIYLSWRCNRGNFNIGAFLVALFCPYIYIIYALAVNGGCGLF